jgi:hypothetical protein
VVQFLPPEVVVLIAAMFAAAMVALLIGLRLGYRGQLEPASRRLRWIGGLAIVASIAAVVGLVMLFLRVMT